MSVFRRVADGVVLELRVTPNASVNAILGLHVASDGVLSLKVKVRAQPEQGKANRGVIEVLAKALGVPKSRFEIVSGETQSRKSLLIRGETLQITIKLEKLLADQGETKA
jgi:uncharacterized protein (TIGR00251 family)